ncbi:hypothetical protein [Hydrogenimonas sp.]
MIWLKRSFLALLAVALWVVLSLLFLSKERLCNGAVEAAASKGVTLCYDGRTASMLGCRLERTTVLYGHAPVAKVGLALFTPWKIEISKIRLEGLAASMLPPKIATVRFEPLGGTIYAEGDFGVLRGDVAWSGRRVNLELTPSSLMKREFGATLREFRQKNGKYTYALSF